MTVYSPVAAVTADFATPVDTDVTVTLAPGMTAPEWSVTVPTIAVSTVCARRPAGATAITSTRNAETSVRMGTSSVREAVVRSWMAKSSYLRAQRLVVSAPTPGVREVR